MQMGQQGEEARWKKDVLGHMQLSVCFKWKYVLLLTQSFQGFLSLSHNAQCNYMCDQKY